MLTLIAELEHLRRIKIDQLKKNTEAFLANGLEYSRLADESTELKSAIDQLGVILKDIK